MTDPRPVKPVFVLFTATTCPGCIHFKSKVWPHLKSTLEERGRVQIVEVEVSTPMDKPDPSVYHKDLSRFIGFFPSMALFPADRWFDPTSELIGIVKNGKLVPPSKDDHGRLVPEHVEIIGKVSSSEDDILKWVDFTLDNPNGFFTRNQNKTQTDKTQTDKTQKNDENVLKNLKRGANGNYMIPTAGHYNRFMPSHTE